MESNTEENPLESEKALPIYYSQRTIYWFSLIFSWFFGAVLLALNIQHTDKKVSRYIILYASVGLVLEAFVLSAINANPAFYFAFNAIGGIILNNSVWNRYIGVDKKYEPRSIWKPLAIGIIITLLLALVVFNGASTTPTAVPIAPTTPTTQVPTPTATPTPLPPKTTPKPVTNTLTLDSLSPTTGAVGTIVTIYGSGFAASNKVLLDGNVGATDVPLSSSTTGHQSLVFSIPSSIGPDCKPDQACPMYMRLVTPATYQVSVENANGTSNSLSFTITGSALNPEIQ